MTPTLTPSPHAAPPDADSIREAQLDACQRHLTALLLKADRAANDYRRECIEAAHARLEVGFGRLVLQRDPEFWRAAAGWEPERLLEEGLRREETCDCGRALERGRCPSFCGEEGL